MLFFCQLFPRCIVQLGSLRFVAEICGSEPGRGFVVEIVINSSTRRGCRPKSKIYRGRRGNRGSLLAVVQCENASHAKRKWKLRWWNKKVKEVRSRSGKLKITNIQPFDNPTHRIRPQSYFRADTGLFEECHDELLLGATLSLSQVSWSNSYLESIELQMAVYALVNSLETNNYQNCVSCGLHCHQYPHL